MPRILLLAGALAGLTACTVAERPETQRPGPRIRLPADDGRHRSPVEWWYWTGQLSASGGQRFAFHLTFFIFDGKLLVDHATLTDLETGQQHSAQGSGPAPPESSSGRFDLRRGTTGARGTGGTDTLAAVFDDGRFELTTRSGRGAVLHHGDGFQSYPFGGHTYYYSRPRLSVTGTVAIGSSVSVVSGTAWFDHQWGDLQPAARAGWDWFGIQLDDGRELMLLVAHPEGKPTFIDATLVGVDHETSRIAPALVSVQRLGTWTSPKSGCTYRLGWKLDVAGLRLTVSPQLEAQEFHDTVQPTTSHWEGIATVSGDATGRAFVELAGYCARPGP